VLLLPIRQLRVHRIQALNWRAINSKAGWFYVGSGRRRHNLRLRVNNRWALGSGSIGFVAVNFTAWWGRDWLDELGDHVVHLDFLLTNALVVNLAFELEGHHTGQVLDLLLLRLNVRHAGLLLLRQAVSEVEHSLAVHDLLHAAIHVGWDDWKTRAASVVVRGDFAAEDDVGARLQL